MRIAFVTLLLVILFGCSSGQINAPVSSRGTKPEPGPTVSSPGSAVAQPATPIRRPLASTDGYYTVRRGDTFYSIAWQQGLAVSDLVQLNNIQFPYTIYPGQRLRVRGVLRASAPIQNQPIPAKQAPQTVSAQRPPSRPTVTPIARPAPKPAKKSVSGAKNITAYDGTWVWPTRGRVLRGFQPKATGKKGIDIGGHHAQPVKAAASGKVVYSGSGLVGYGKLIIVKHNENLLSAYGHNSKLLVAEGDHVKAGEMIAKMGNSGTNRTALYFEIRKGGKPVNPMQYLPRN